MGWGDFNPPKTLAISSNPFDNLDKDKALKRSKKAFYDYLPTPAYLSFIDSKDIVDDEDPNQWQIIYIFVLGREGSGKSVAIDALAQWFREFYVGRKKRYEDLVYTAATAKHLDYLYNTIPKGKKYVFLAAEDMTKVEVDLHASKRRRWICQEKTGNDSGVIVQIGGLHDWFSIHKLLRDAASLVVAKSAKAKLNVHDSSHQNLFMSRTGVKFILQAMKYRLLVKSKKTKGKVAKAFSKYGCYFGYGTVWDSLTEKASLWYNPKLVIPLNTVYDLQYQRQGDETEPDELYELPEYELIEPDYFHWEEATFKVISKSEKEKIKTYTKFFKAKYLDDLDYNRQVTWDALKLGKTTIHKRYREMENGQTSIGGFISKVRGELFEQHILAVLETFGIPTEANPTIHYNGYEYQDDLKVLDNFIINAKCGRGLRQYTREKKLSESGESVKGHYKSTWAFAKNGFETYILYYDLETDLVTVIDKNAILMLDKINVGGKRKDFPQLPLTKALERILCLTPSLLSSPSDTFVAQESEQEKTSQEIPKPAQKGVGGDTVKEQKEDKN